VVLHQNTHGSLGVNPIFDTISFSINLWVLLSILNILQQFNDLTLALNNIEN
jgi:hypothetical protein